MNWWFYAMGSALLIVAVPAWPSVRAAPLAFLWLPKIRTGLAMIGTSAATYLYQDALFYACLSLAGGSIVLSYPMGNMQRLIGWCFIAMACMSAGFIAGEITNLQNSSSYAFVFSQLTESIRIVGHAMTAIFFAWVGHDTFRNYRLVAAADDDLPANAVEHEA